MYYRVLQDFTFGKIGGKKDSVIRVPIYYVPYLLFMGYIAPVHPASPGPARNINYYDADGNIIFTIDTANRRINFPIPGILSIGNVPVTATAAELNAVSGLGSDIETGEIRDGAVTPAKTSGIAMLYDLGKPAKAAVNKVCLIQEMDNKEYTLEAGADPDIPRNITVTRTTAGDADTPGIITITGTNFNDDVISEEITPGDNSATVPGLKAFKTITSVIGSEWAAEGAADSITVGWGDALGCHAAAADADNIVLGMLGGTVVAHNPTAGATIELATVDMSSGTYDGAKTALIWQKN